MVKKIQKMIKRESGFTLIELLVVIGIIAILATIGAINFGSARAKARDAKRIADLKQIQAAVEVIAAGSAPGLYPTATAAGLGTEIIAVSPPDATDVYCYYVRGDKLEYVLSSQQIETIENAAQGYNGGTTTTTWGLYELEQTAGTGTCAPAAANVPDCDDTAIQTYCLQGTTAV